MDKKTTLVVMAAGMGSRFGGLKQIEPIGSNGESILDFSIFDAAKAGFNKAIFIIRRDIEKDFREFISKHIEKMIDTELVFQDMDNIPTGFKVPEGRTKPWGTGHAVYCAREKTDTPFALINADDYYGQTSFKLIHDRLIEKSDTCMVGFELGKTLTDNGTVSRGICEVENGFLKKITEHTALDRNSDFPLDTIVSMNMWGFTPDIFTNVENDFIEFLQNLKNPLKEEFYIPTVVDKMISSGTDVHVLKTADKWYGITYREDKKIVTEALNKLISGGFYNGI